MRVRRVSGAADIPRATTPLIEREKAGFIAIESGRHKDVFQIDGEMDEDAPIELED